MKVTKDKKLERQIRSLFWAQKVIKINWFSCIHGESFIKESQSIEYEGGICLKVLLI